MKRYSKINKIITILCIMVITLSPTATVFGYQTEQDDWSYEQQIAEENDEALNGRENEQLSELIVDVGDDESTDNNSDSEGSEWIVVTDDVVSAIALEWAEFIEPDLNLQIGKITPLYDYDDLKCGYQASYFMKDVPYGYIILDFSAENIITEFLIEQDKKSFAASVLENAGINSNIDAVSSRNKASDVKMYKGLPFQYTVSVEQNGIDSFYDFKGELAEEEFLFEREQISTEIRKNTLSRASTSSTPQFDHFGELIVDTIPTQYTTVDPLTQLGNRVSISEWRAHNEVGRYACVVQAMVNVASQEGILLNNSFRDTYNFLWTDTETQIDHEENGIIFGWTWYNRMGPSLVALARRVNRTATQTSTTAPTYTTFRNAVDNNRSSIFGSEIRHTSGTIIGHAVSVVGYRSARDGSGALFQYLNVADGWNADTFRYICISNTAPFTSMYGMVLTMN